MNELDESVDILDRHSLILLVEVVDVAVQDLDKKFDRDAGIHAGICNTEGTLETFKDALAITVKLQR